MSDYYVYMMTNRNNTVIYTGVTNDLLRRISEHKLGIDQDSFTSKYKLTKLIYFEQTNDIITAIEFEKKIKAGSRNKKNKLINQMNPKWKDLSKNFYEIASLRSQ